MGDLISRKATIKALKADYKDCIADPGEGHLIAVGLESAIDILRDIQGEDATPVVHGRWVLTVEKGHCMDFHVKAHCSECGHEWFSKDGVGNYSSVFSAFVRGTDEDATEFVLQEASKRKLFRFCPNCGAKMDKEDA